MATFSAPRGASASTSSRTPSAFIKPLVRNAAGKLEPATWDHALRVAAGKLKEIRDGRGGAAIGVLGSNRTTNEENLSAAEVRAYRSPHQQHRPPAHGRLRILRAAPWPATKARPPACAMWAPAPAILLIGGDPTNEHPLLAWQIRTNVRLNKAPALHRQSPRDQAGAPGQGSAGPAARRVSRPDRHPRPQRYPTSPKP